MALPFTVEAFYGVFRDGNATVCPVQRVPVALALAAVVAALRPRRGSSSAFQ